MARPRSEPRTLLERAQAIEDAYGRERTGHWAPRTLDVDLIMVGNAVVDSDDLKLPHPLAQERGFVLVPWVEVDPRGEVPGRGSLSALVDQVDRSGITRRDDLAID